MESMAQVWEVLRLGGGALLALVTPPLNWGGEFVSQGWTLARRYWGFGYATEAATAARDWAVQELRPPRLISLIHPDNVRSQRVSEKLGQRYERDVVTRGRPAQLWST